MITSAWPSLLQEFIDMCDFAVGLSRQINGSVIPSESKSTCCASLWLVD